MVIVEGRRRRRTKPDAAMHVTRAVCAKRARQLRLILSTIPEGAQTVLQGRQLLDSSYTPTNGIGNEMLHACHGFLDLSGSAAPGWSIFLSGAGNGGIHSPKPVSAFDCAPGGRQRRPVASRQWVGMIKRKPNSPAQLTQRDALRRDVRTAQPGCVCPEAALRTFQARFPASHAC